MPVREVTEALDEPESERWFAPGSLLRVRWDTAHPIAAGMPEESAVFYARDAFDAMNIAGAVAIAFTVLLIVLTRPRVGIN